ncbi:polymerase [Yata virus]|uniref:Replicase n=1 Tax=Yata virus TaxID=1272960 RepID=A0A096ZGU9_9RHAB|nr:polymerase [Yata virus]AIR95579.1 polymerase [Yata virus]
MDFFNESVDLSDVNDFNFEEIYDDLDDTNSLFDDFDDPMELINNKDYNLNSPLIRDELDQLYSYLTYNISPRDKRRLREFEEVELYINSCNLSGKLSHPDTIQSCIGKDRLEIINTFKYQLFGEALDREIKKGKKVLDAFTRGWIGSTVMDNLDFLKIWMDVPQVAKSWFEKFMGFHKLILILNRTGEYETRELIERLNITRLQFKGKDLCLKYDNSVVGTMIIFKNYVYSYKWNLILDRNTCLMIKDVLISRFQTILSMLLAQYEVKYTDADVNHLVRIYEEGDSLLNKHGNKAYSGIKMLEPMCNLQITEIARLSRPLIPEFPNFKNHIINSVIELDKKGIDIAPFKTLVDSVNNLDLLLTIYGSFRHWGHPYLDYLDGLEKLHTQVNLNLKVNTDYANLLASDLAYKVLHNMFFEKKKWFVDHTKLDPKCKLTQHIRKNTWPTQGVIDEFGDKWHTLPLTKCFDVPDMIDPSMIYSDKSHSMQRSEVLECIQNHSDKPIPTRRVLKTLLEKEATDWPKFLERVDKYGLDWESLVIGLKGKERELKEAGRFFSLMSWELREYFVVTELLIKQHYVKLFKGLTMADDLQTVIKKMLDTSHGQGTRTYDAITIANNIDYEKWNNYQRMESNGPVFRVMGQFLGYPNLILRTHEFFQKSLIYYNQRPDLMRVVGKSAMNSTKHIVCWEGQLGGLEGLRQKGWSVVNYLMIERESKVRNTLVKVLAQGDNQTITTHYKTETWRNEEELKSHINRMVENNKAIMDNIIAGTMKLGLKINEDETMQSADYINYGKVPIIEGVIRGLNTKRWSRVNFVTNDQVPNQTSVLSSVSTNSLTVAHFSNTALDAMVGHLIFGTFGLLMLDFHNPALRTSPIKLIKDKAAYQSDEFRILSLYLDPSLGGTGGTSLTRFLIRMFPDPVTESISFWKIVHDNTADADLKRLAISCGNPRLSQFRDTDLDKLIDQPESLNIPRGISANNLIKGEVKKNIIWQANSIKNKVIQDAAKNCLTEENILFNWLRSIKPLFPRFISQFASSTYYGVTQSLIGLFTNSKTIRGTYRRTYKKELDQIVLKSELISITSLISIIKRANGICKYLNIWGCSASQADYLRRLSWNTSVLGMTIPHPIEMFEACNSGQSLCKYCTSDDIPHTDAYITVLCPKGIPKKAEFKGPYSPYLGSRTLESTSILQPWEKETRIPVIKRAADLRKAISWFIDEDSNLAKSIYNNLSALTGETWDERIEGFKRTGSPLHRFTCSRVSAGGYTACAPGKICWTIVTTDTMNSLGSTNYDFMYQASMIYAQSQCIESIQGANRSMVYHYHIRCKDCLREIEEPILESDWIYEPMNVAHILEKWRPDQVTKWSKNRSRVQVTDDSKLWSSINDFQKSREVGKTIGFLYGDIILGKGRDLEERSLFPLSIRSKIDPREFFSGLLTGIKLASSLHLTHRRNIIILKRPSLALFGTVYYVVERLTEDSIFLNFISGENLYHEICSIPHKVPTSYPLNHIDVGSIGRSYLKSRVRDILENKELTTSWAFSDMRSIKLIGSYALSHETIKLISKQEGGKEDRVKISQLQQIYVNLVNDDNEDIDNGSIIKELSKHLRFCDQEIRHAVKFDIKILPMSRPILDTRSWGQEYVGNIIEFKIVLDGYNTAGVTDTPTINVPYRSNPMISGLRLNQIATGAHYKIRTLIRQLNIKYTDFLCGGDGSGGITAYLLRENPCSRGIFNSLLCLDGVPLHGSKPSPPPAVMEMGKLKEHCVNLLSVWKEPSDLSWEDTWIYFRKCKSEYNLKIDLIVLDMECTDVPTVCIIFDCLRKHLGYLLQNGGCIIIKTYYSLLLKRETSLVDRVAEIFSFIGVYQTSMSSTNTSEVYVVARGFSPGLKPKMGSVKSVLESEYKNALCNRAPIDEFNRAQALRFSKLDSGLPIDLIPNLVVEFSTLLTIAGLDGVTMAFLTRSRCTHGLNGLELGIIVKLLVSEHYISTTKVIHKSVNIPSDQELKKMFSCLIGIDLALSWLYKDPRVYEICDMMINEDFKVVIYKFKNHQRWKILSLNKELKSNDIQYKICSVRSKMANMGSWIRLWAKKFQSNSTNKVVRADKVNGVLKSINRGLDLTIISEKTGLLI